MKTRVVLLIGSALITAACTATSTDPATTTTGAGAVTTSTVPDSTTTTAPSPTTTASSSTATTTAPPSTTTTTLAGEVLDFGPQQGAILAVVGVRHDDVLNLRAGPGTDQAVVAELSPVEHGVVALGNARSLPNSIWYEVEVDGVSGWASSSFLGALGVVGDITSQIVADLGGIPGAETMVDLGLIVAESQASTEPASRIQMSVAPTVGDLGEITFDVIGLGDDAVAGIRLHLFASPDDSGESFSLKSVEATTICQPHRGTTAEGLCN